MNLLIILSSFHDSNGVQELANSLRPNGSAGYRSLPYQLARAAGEFKGGRRRYRDLLWRRARKTSVARSNPRRGNPP